MMNKQTNITNIIIITVLNVIKLTKSPFFVELYHQKIAVYEQVIFHSLTYNMEFISRVGKVVSIFMNARHEGTYS